MRPKFRNGDIVYNRWGHRIRVVRSYGRNGQLLYQGEDCFSKHLEEYAEDDLSFNYDHLKPQQEDFVPPEKVCPKCKNAWSITGFGKKRWYDCKTCKDSAENIYNKKDNNPPKFDWTRISGWSDDDSF